MSIDSDFRRGSKTSSSIMEEETVQTVNQFMRSSFYLPVNILKHQEWQVYPIEVMTGEQFKHAYGDAANLHCLEEFELQVTARFVAVSSRRHLLTRERFHVSKIWYGAAPK